MITKYFQYNCEDAERIAMVEADNEDAIYSAGFSASDELDETELPEDFPSWRRYESFAKGEASAIVMSKEGD